MPNVQQPEMRRSGKDPLVQDSAKISPDQVGGAGGAADPRPGQKVPKDQQSPYGPSENDG